MSQKANIIEINGKRYDALSGKLLGDAGSASIVNSIHRRSAGSSMDGFVTKKSSATTAAAVVPSVVTAKPVAALSSTTPQFSDVIRRAPVVHAKHHKTSPSKTLMRHAVAKPAPASLKRLAKVQQRTDVLVKQPSITVKPKMSSYQLDATRVQRAKQVAKHPEANRYAVARPALAATTAPSPTITAPIAKAVATSDVRATQPKQSALPRATDIFEQALARANSHAEKPHARRHTKHRKGLFGGRALSISTAAFAVLLIVGFFAWQQKTSLTMRYAAAKSGISASLPGYKPAGFSASTFNYSPGLVAVNFKNNSNGDSFALIEKSSTWDSQALVDSFVATKSRTFQTIDAAGRTIYTYGNNATWVDNGIWYQVNSQGSLSTNQLVQLALSM